MNIILSVIGLCFSLQAFAGYECKIRLSDARETEKVLIEKSVTASGASMRSEMIKNLIVEFNKENQSSIDLKATIVGWPGQEEISFKAFRRSESSLTSLEILSNSKVLRGSDAETFWFDSYQLDTSCSIT